MTRACSFISGEGPDATKDLLASLTPYGARIAENIKIYQSLDMKSGINVSELLGCKEMLNDFLLIDPRGGYFTQASMSQGLSTMMSQNAVVKQQLLANTLALAKPYDDIIQTVAYKIRVMLAHIRRL